MAAPFTVDQRLAAAVRTASNPLGSLRIEIFSDV